MYTSIRTVSAVAVNDIHKLMFLFIIAEHMFLFKH
nr:MAG TPA: hypothetical protein [Caudoviricetes sp.]